jgi:hypothetical protein
VFPEWHRKPVAFVVMRPVMAAGDYDASLFASLEPKLQLLADDLAWWAKALAGARAVHEAAAR